MEATSSTSKYFDILKNIAEEFALKSPYASLNTSDSESPPCDYLNNATSLPEIQGQLKQDSPQKQGEGYFVSDIKSYENLDGIENIKDGSLQISENLVQDSADNSESLQNVLDKSCNSAVALNSNTPFPVQRNYSLSYLLNSANLIQGSSDSFEYLQGKSCNSPVALNSNPPFPAQKNDSPSSLLNSANLIQGSSDSFEYLQGKSCNSPVALNSNPSFPVQKNDSPSSLLNSVNLIQGSTDSFENLQGKSCSSPVALNSNPTFPVQRNYSLSYSLNSANLIQSSSDNFEYLQGKSCNSPVALNSNLPFPVQKNESPSSLLNSANLILDSTDSFENLQEKSCSSPVALNSNPPFLDQTNGSTSSLLSSSNLIQGSADSSENLQDNLLGKSCNSPVVIDNEQPPALENDSPSFLLNSANLIQDSADSSENLQDDLLRKSCNLPVVIEDEKIHSSSGSSSVDAFENIQEDFKSFNSPTALNKEPSPVLKNDRPEFTEMSSSDVAEFFKEYNFMPNEVILLETSKGLWPVLVQKIYKEAVLVYVLSHNSPHEGFIVKKEYLKFQTFTLEAKKRLLNEANSKSDMVLIETIKKASNYTFTLCEEDPKVFFGIEENTKFKMWEDFFISEENETSSLQRSLRDATKPLDSQELASIWNHLLGFECREHVLHIANGSLKTKRCELFIKGHSESKLRSMAKFGPFGSKTKKKKLKYHFESLFKNKGLKKYFMKQVIIPEAIIKAISLALQIPKHRAEDIFVNQPTTDPSYERDEFLNIIKPKENY